MLRLRAVGWLVIVTVWAGNSEVHGDFVSFFDHAPGPNTDPLTLVFPEQTSGNWGFLTNFNTGITTPVAMSSFVSNSVTTGATASTPAAGTPAYNTFNGFVDFKGSPSEAIQLTTNNSFVVLTFSNLNPALRYNFKGSAVRGGADYTNRWTKVTILGADSAASAHTANALTTAQAPADLGPNDVAICFGQNHLPNQGDMAVWDDINPGPDGVFQIVCTRYVGYVPNGTSLNAPHAYAITGVRLQEFFPDPALITSGPSPASASVDEGQTASFEVTVSGTAPKFQWYREDGHPLLHAVATNRSTLTLTNIDFADAGVYHVRVYNSISIKDSDPAMLTVTPDRIAPTLFSGLGYADRTNFLVTFSEPLDTTKVLQTSAFQIHLTSGGGTLPFFRAVFTNGTNILLSTTIPRTPSLNYSVNADAGAVTDRYGNLSTAGEIPISAQVLLLTFSGTAWKFRGDGTDLGSSWYLDPTYDDSSWSNGLSVFDGKTPQPPGRTNIGGFTVATQLALTNGLWPTTAGVIPTYYFRTHFTLATTPDHVLSLKLRTLVDDFEDFFINQEEAYRNPGYLSANPPPAFGYAGGTAVGNAAVAGPFDVAPNKLRAGDNIAAVIVNQANAGSSDATFAYELMATIDRFTPAPRLAIGPDPASPGNLLISWEGGSQLYETSEVDASAGSWTVVSGVTGSSYSFAPGGTQKFYTIRQ